MIRVRAEVFGVDTKFRILTLNRVDARYVISLVKVYTAHYRNVSIALYMPADAIIVLRDQCI